MNALIAFTPARERGVNWLGGGSEENGKEGESELSGEQVKHFYENLIGLQAGRNAVATSLGGDTSGRNGASRGTARRRKHPHVATERDGHGLLKCAQEGDVAGLKALLDKEGCDINFRDTYYWTATMCASYAGQRDAVKLLLRSGAAWVGVVDTQGRDARDLADQAGHVAVVKELEEFGHQRETPRSASSVTAQELHWCSVCGAQFTESEDRHRSSTLHQFSLRRPPPTPQYCLPSTNAGFRMMLREGWKPGAGLGPCGAGRRQPISTVLKRDQGGLGYGSAPRARVTHFKGGDKRAVQKPPGTGVRAERVSTLSRKVQKRKEQKDKNWERDFRTSFNL